MSKLHVVKIGGNVINNPDDLDAFLSAYSQLPEPKILVHGGGKKATELAQHLGLQATMVQGRRITDKPMLEVAVMAYAGWINKTIVSKLQALETNALGLSGADANYFTTTQRPVAEVDYGFVGDVLPQSVNATTLRGFIAMDLSPVCCAITHNGQGQLLNTNADTIAASIARAMAAQYSVQLVYCFELPGLMRDIHQPDSKIDRLNTEAVNQLKAEGTIHSGMHPKIDNCLDALAHGVSQVAICHWQDVANPKKGTVIEE